MLRVAGIAPPGLGRAAAGQPGAARAAAAANTPTAAEIIAASAQQEWRALDPARTLYLQLPAGRVIIELAPDMAPLHVANILRLVAGHYFDGLAVIRVQDNFVAQWGDADDRKSLGSASAKLPSEYTSAYDAAAPFTRLQGADGYAPEVGFVAGMPAGRDPASRTRWLAHCYGALAVARGNDPESGNGSSLYVVIGQAPRQLDRNLAVVGHVWQGMELLSALARGGGALGFYDQPAQYLTITSLRRAADLPEAERTPLEVLREDSRSFARLIDARRNRHDDFIRFSAGFVDVCNVPVPVRRP